ncbi:uncharacterized protein LOC121077260 [Cygnus olor]|uniref:uncharacterized protein LOC121077260 n=1 Tax=Cygnus olor TaxID=8869 RepID=UPI001ADEB4FD|nr:uncharacterized protein LOC121077260 [Cygnus olor]
MCPGRRCWGLGSLLLLLLLGRNLGFLVEIPHDAVSGTVGQSVLLPVSYTFNSSPHFPVSIKWRFGHPSQVIISCTVLNCSLSAGGAPKNCSTKCFPHASHAGRVELFPENASLLLRDLKLSDSGVYNVSFVQQQQSRHITLTVLEQPVPTGPSSEGTSNQDHTHNYIIGACSLIFLLLLFLVFCVWRWVQQKKMRIVKQQQALNTQEPHVDNTAAREIMTIYSRVGDSFEHPELRASPQVIYSSITSLNS